MKKREELKQQELNPYANDKLAKIPSWIKILLLKIWAASAAFYLFGSASASIHNNIEDVMLIFMGLGYTLFSDLVVKTIIRFMRNSRDDTFRFNAINKKGIIGLLIQLVYCYGIMIPSAILYGILAKHGIYINLFGLPTTGFEPITFGIVVTIVDIIAIVIKNLAIYIYKKIKHNRDQKLVKEIQEEINNLGDE